MSLIKKKEEVSLTIQKGHAVFPQAPSCLVHFGSIVSLLQEAHSVSSEQQSASGNDVDEKYQCVRLSETESHSVYAIRLWKLAFYYIYAAEIVTVAVRASVPLCVFKLK